MRTPSGEYDGLHPRCIDRGHEDGCQITRLSLALSGVLLCVQSQFDEVFIYSLLKILPPVSANVNFIDGLAVKALTKLNNVSL